MSEILGYDINQRPLRAGDRVKMVAHKCAFDALFDGLEGTVVGAWSPSPITGKERVDTDIPDGDGDTLCSPCDQLERLNDDHDPAEDYFTEWLHTHLRQADEDRVLAGMLWTDGEVR